jgi:hypothetical protein
MVVISKLFFFCEASHHGPWSSQSHVIRSADRKNLKFRASSQEEGEANETGTHKSAPNSNKLTAAPTTTDDRRHDAAAFTS